MRIQVRTNEAVMAHADMTHAVMIQTVMTEAAVTHAVMIQTFTFCRPLR